MILVWGDAVSFNRHLERCRNNTVSSWLFRDMPVPGDIRPPEGAGGVNRRSEACGRDITVPVRKINVPGGGQN